MYSRQKILLFFSESQAEISAWCMNFGDYLGIILTQIALGEYELFSNLEIRGVHLSGSDEIKPEQFGLVLLVVDLKKTTDSTIDDLRNRFSNPGSGKPFNIFVVAHNSDSSTFIPDWLNNFPVYRFFELNHRTLEILNYSAEIPGESESGFWMKLTDLAYDIKFLKGSTGESLKRENTIFLAEVSIDQVKNRDNLRRELLLSGYNVLPLHPLPHDLNNFEFYVKDLMSKCCLSIHFLGEQYGEAPENSDYSFQELQNRYFADLSKQQASEDIHPKIHRLIWLQSDLETSHDKQNQYIKRIKRDLPVLINTEMVQSTLTDLKEIIDRKMQVINSPAFELLDDVADKPNFYVIADRHDQNFIRAVEKVFNARYIKYQVFVSENSSFLNIESFMETLKKQKNILICNSQQKYTWISNLITLIARSKGYNDAIPINEIGVFTKINIEHLNGYIPLDIHTFLVNNESFEDKLVKYISKYSL